MNGSLTIETARVDDGILLVGVQGEIDIDTAAEVRELLLSACDEAKHVVFDLGRVSFIDSTGLGVIVAASTRAEQQGADFSLLRPAPPILRTLKMFGLDAMIRDLDMTNRS